MKHILALLALLSGLSTFASDLDTIRVSTLTTSHIRFSSELKYVDVSSRSVAVKIPDGGKDILAVKARESFEHSATVSCLEANGNMHTFIILYDADATPGVFDTRLKESGTSAQSGATDDNTFERIASKKKSIYHIGARDYGIEVYCDNIFVQNDITYIVLELRNGSAVTYERSEPRFAVESKKKTKRGLVYEKQVFPKYSWGPTKTAPQERSKIVYAFDKISLLKGQVLRCYIYEEGGSRGFTATFCAEDINKAQRL